MVNVFREIFKFIEKCETPMGAGLGRFGLQYLTGGNFIYKSNKKKEKK
jgi:hypothetical protein